MMTATYGVTGHFEGRQVGDDDGAVAPFMSNFESRASRSAWLREPEFGRLLPVCCPTS
jgi:hypothetical protein